jgi:hypothetical protein
VPDYTSADHATETEIVMSDDVRNELLPLDSGSGPLRHFRIGRRSVLQTLAGGVSAAVFASQAAAQHAHHAAVGAAAPAALPAAAAAGTADSALLFLDNHAFETLATLSEQIVPGSRAAKVPEFLDRLLDVETTETQKRFTQALGAFEREAREAHGMPWKALTSEQATALLTKISAQPSGTPTREAFDGVKGAVAETYYSSEVGMKELGWNGGIAFAPPPVCG